MRLVQGQWRYSDVKIVEVDFIGPGPDGKPTGTPVKTYDYRPQAGAADFDDSKWDVIDPKDDGRLINAHIFFDATRWKKANYSGPDGLIVDREGNLFAARPGGINVFAPDGSLLGSIETGVATSHCAWGDEGSTLYITASSAVFRIRLSTRGIGFEKGLG